MTPPCRYHEMLDCMAAADIEPNATLHHFTHPQWFEDLGGFEKEENIPLFVGWCVKAVELFGSRIHFWATFNEPTVSAAGNHHQVYQDGVEEHAHAVCIGSKK
jgi:beta-glucosidase/6-phospho-beta-glucosidase/beta-galactosidase